MVKNKYLYSNDLDAENVTFWVGPKEPTSNSMLDQMPSANGFYVHPSKVDVAIFALEKLPVYSFFGPHHFVLFRQLKQNLEVQLAEKLY